MDFLKRKTSGPLCINKRELTSPFFAVPAPRQLTLERQLNKSILIGWTSPDCPPGQIEMYHVYVDGFLRTTVRATDKTKALVEGVDNARVSYLCSQGAAYFRNDIKSAFFGYFLAEREFFFFGLL